jgi:hypothetical protein
VCSGEIFRVCRLARAAVVNVENCDAFATLGLSVLAILDAAGTQNRKLETW